MSITPSITYSDRLGAITHQQFQRALSRLGLGAFLSAQPTTSGMFGQNIFISSTSGEYVLRGCPHDERQFPRERFIARVMHEQSSAPGPWPYTIDPSSDIFGWPYALMRRLPGHRIESPFKETLSASDRRGIATAFGAVLAQLGTVRLPACGAHDRILDAISPSEGGWKGHMRRTMEGHLEHASRCSPDTIAADRAWIRPFVDRGFQALDVPFDPTVCSSDFGENNGHVVKEGEIWKVTGIYDLMEWFSGDPEFSLPRQALGYLDEDPQLAYDFIAAYASIRPLRSGFASRLYLYTISDRFIFWNFGHDRKWFDPTHEFSRFAEPSLVKLRAVVERLAAAGLGAAGLGDGE